MNEKVINLRPMCQGLMQTTCTWSIFPVRGLEHIFLHTFNLKKQIISLDRNARVRSLCYYVQASMPKGMHSRDFQDMRRNLRRTHSNQIHFQGTYRYIRDIFVFRQPPLQSFLIAGRQLSVCKTYLPLQTCGKIFLAYLLNLIYFYRMDYSTLTLWTDPFPIQWSF